MEDRDLYCIVYKFRFEDGQDKKFPIPIDPGTVTIVGKIPDSLPAWTELNVGQCDCCPLTESEFPHCPIAVNICGVVEEFKHAISHDSCIVSCRTPERTYMKKTSVMEGLTSIFGVIMATSNCPIMDFFKPMARFHLPFSSFEESLFRIVSTFLLRQYFEREQPESVYVDLKLLDRQYEKVHIVNEGLLNRIKTVTTDDADNNAIITLHSMGKLLAMEFSYDLETLRPLFQ